ncbi:MAG TPA: hypothetical protein VK539_13745 [Myxococcaceae bacterium]|nr:hypothetical protein [Myxococcaceae bacterium]
MPPRPTPYRVAFSPKAWHQIGQMPHVMFQALQAALDAIAQEMDAPKANDSAETERRKMAAGLVIIYQRDDAARSLTVLEVRPGPAEP